MIKRLYLASLVLSILGGAFLACDDDETTNPVTGTDAGSDTGASSSGATSSSGSTTSSSGGSSGTSSSSSGDGGNTKPWSYEAGVIANFDVTKRELPDDIAIIPGAAGEYGTPVVGLNNTGKVAKLTGGGKYEIIAEFGSWSPAARLLGLTWDPTDGFIGNVVTFNPAVKNPAPGLYKIPADGGGAPTALTAANDPNVGLPNVGRKLGDSMYVGDSDGWVTKVKIADGTTTKWATGPLFEGNKNACPAGALATPRPLGADAVAIKGNDVYVTNFDYGSLIKIPVNGDGTAGTPVVIYQGLANGGTDCTLQSIDGLAIDTDGSFWVGNSLKNTLYHLSADGKTLGNPVLEGKPPFDQISNMVIESIPGKKKRLLISNFANGAFTVDAGPIPQLLQVDLPPDP